MLVDVYQWELDGTPLVAMHHAHAPQPHPPAGIHRSRCSLQRTPLAWNAVARRGARPTVSRRGLKLSTGRWCRLLRVATGAGGGRRAGLEGVPCVQKVSSVLFGLVAYPFNSLSSMSNGRRARKRDEQCALSTGISLEPPTTARREEPLPTDRSH